MKNEIKEKSVIEICIIRSKHIRLMKEVLVSLRATKTAITKSPIHFPSEDKLKDLENEIKNRISEFEMSIAKMLKPLLTIHGIYLENKYWLTEQEIKEGYVLLMKPNSLGASHVLFLRDHIDTFDGSKVNEGEIKLYKQVNHFLERLDATIEAKRTRIKSKTDESNS